MDFGWAPRELPTKYTEDELSSEGAMALLLFWVCSLFSWGSSGDKLSVSKVNSSKSYPRNKRMWA
jgi:hypothetical protein